MGNIYIGKRAALKARAHLLWNNHKFSVQRSKSLSEIISMLMATLGKKLISGLSNWQVEELKRSVPAGGICWFGLSRRELCHLRWQSLVAPLL